MHIAVCPGDAPRYSSYWPFEFLEVVIPQFGVPNFYTKPHWCHDQKDEIVYPAMG